MYRMQSRRSLGADWQPEASSNLQRPVPKSGHPPVGRDSESQRLEGLTSELAAHTIQGRGCVGKPRAGLRPDALTRARDNLNVEPIATVEKEGDGRFAS